MALKRLYSRIESAVGLLVSGLAKQPLGRSCSGSSLSGAASGANTLLSRNSRDGHAWNFARQTRQLVCGPLLSAILKRLQQDGNFGLQRNLHLGGAAELAGTAKENTRSSPRTRRTLADSEYAWLAVQLHPTKNEPSLRLDMISTGSQQRLWWQCQGCPDCGRVHEWEAPVVRRAGSGGVLPTGCPSCSLRGGSGTSTCFCRSVASDAQLSREWCSEKNGGVLPAAVALQSCTKRMWRCLRNPSHPAYEATPSSRSVNGAGCPECGKEASRIKTRRGLLAEEHPGLAAQWDHERNDRTLKGITSGSDYMASWICPESTCQHPHRWRTEVNKRTSKRRGHGCPFCSGLSCCPCNSIARKYPELLAEWDSDRNAAEGRIPEQVGPCSNIRVWWTNEGRGPWQQTPNERVRILERMKRKEGLRRTAGQLDKCVTG